MTQKTAYDRLNESPKSPEKTISQDFSRDRSASMNVQSPDSSANLDMRASKNADLMETEIVCEGIEVTYDVTEDNRKVLSKETLVTILDKRNVFPKLVNIKAEYL